MNQQQVQHPASMVMHETPVAMLLKHHHHHQQNHEHTGRMIEQGQASAMGMATEEEDEEDEEEDDPSELAVAVQHTGNAMEGLPTSNAVVGSPESALGGLLGKNQQQNSQQNRVRTVSASGMQMPLLPVPCCRVDGCGEDLSGAGDYHRRHKVCKMHATSPKVINHGQEQRFCQQCSRFHALSEFDEGKRSCRKRLAGHNERRRRHQPDSFPTTSSESPPLALAQGRESSKKPRGGRASSGGGRRSGSTRAALTFGGVRGRLEDTQALMLRGDETPPSKQRRSLKSGEDTYMLYNEGKERGMRFADHGGDDDTNYKEIDELDIDIADMEQVKEGLDMGEGVVIPPLPLKRDGKITLLKGGSQDGEDIQIDELRKDDADKRAWQRDDKEALIHCFWDCPKVQPVWRWASRQLSKLKGSKVRLDVRQALFGAKLDSNWASPENLSVWKLLRGVILWQIWLARKGKVSSGIQWTSNKVIRAVWVDLKMYAVQDWFEVLKKKDAEDAYDLLGKFDNKWLVNQFAGKRAEWSMVWKEPDDLLLE